MDLDLGQLSRAQPCTSFRDEEPIHSLCLWFGDEVCIELTAEAPEGAEIILSELIAGAQETRDRIRRTAGVRVRG